MKKVFFGSIFLVLILFLALSGYLSKKENQQVIKKRVTIKEPQKQTSKPTIPKKEIKEFPKEEKVYETSFERKSRAMGIVIGTPADDVLAIRGKPPYPSEVMGRDENGLIVEWEYKDGIYVFRIFEINGISCYRVAEMKL